ncbi:hypothetical protein DPMN_047704 [Dreissena polymorpha]|uniref:Uncharacterized protein n=1 Tax=Dreissena polymorpha TaxID=45954 RepID=A0A9D4D874_DREPO|nr:hypothetical protein DPMN_047704 [Dreissena polymorpha]
MNRDSVEELKRKREASSVSDTSMNEAKKNEKSDKQKKKKAKQKQNDNKCGRNESETEDDIDVALEMKRLNKKLEKLGESINVLNKKLENSIMKGDGSVRTEIRELFTEMKDDLLKSVTHKIDVIESHLFENDQAVEKLKTEIKTLKEELNIQKDINNTITLEMKHIDLNRKKYENESEQYSRANNI